MNDKLLERNKGSQKGEDYKKNTDEHNERAVIIDRKCHLIWREKG